MKKIILVQHCQSEHHINDMSGGWTDTPLTELGRNQATLIANRLKKEISKENFMLYTSDLKRAYQTAEIIATKISLSIQIELDLREINTGIAAGKTKEWTNSHRNPRQGRNFNLDHQEFPEGETWREFYSRTSKCMQNLCQKNKKNLLIVSHGGTIGFIIAWWLQFDDRMLENAYICASPASISILQESLHYNQHMLTKLNDTSHLQDLK